jgi:plasmid stabilization system protein ParE
MMRQIQLSALAGLDLSGIWDHVATQSGNPEIANKVLERIGERLMLLRRVPLVGRLRSDIDQGLRSFVIEQLIYYRILRIIHGKRDQGLIDLGESN